MKNKLIKKLRVGLVLASCSFLFHSCSSSKVTTPFSSTSGSIYANPDAITFSATQLSLMLRQAYLNLSYSFPPTSDTTAILEAADDTAAKTAYDAAIDTLIDSGVMKDRLKQFFFHISGIGSLLEPTDMKAEKSRLPGNLFAYVVLNGKPMSELFLATYEVRDSGQLDYTLMQNDYPDPPPPDNERAGYITTHQYLLKYMNQHTFILIREMLAMGLNAKAPFTGFDFYRWTSPGEGITNVPFINAQYRDDVVDNIDCRPCHEAFNPLRGAFHHWDPVNVVWHDPNGLATQVITQKQDQYKEEVTGTNDSALEPRNNPADDVMGIVMNVDTAAPYYKMTASGTPFTNIRDFATAIIEYPTFPDAWCERLLSLLLNLDEGNPGAGLVVPNNFSSNPAAVAFKAKWTDTFKTLGLVPKEFIRTFLKSNDFIVSGYADPNHS